MGATISISFKIDSGDSFKKLTLNAESLKKTLGSTVIEAEKLNKSLINKAALVGVYNALSSSISSLKSVCGELVSAYSAQIEAETKLANAMQNTMDATSEEIRLIKDLCSAQQKLGVIGDEVQLAGAQRLATHLKECDSLKALIPVVNDVVAKQYGMSATQENAANVAAIFGKAIDGQTSILKRYGFSFDEVEEKVLKYGSEQEKIAVLSEIVERKVGGVNAALAQTPAGQFKQLTNELGDFKETLGRVATSIMPVITSIAALTTAIVNTVKIATGLKVLVTTMIALTKSIKAVVVASEIWKATQISLNAIITANPVGVLVMAIAGLIALLYTAYNSSEEFRNGCDKLWQSIKPLAEAIIKGLVKAFEWVCEKAKIAFDWICKILGLSGEKVEVEVDVKKKSDVDESIYDDIMKKYANYTPPKINNHQNTTKVNTEPVYNANANTIKGYNDNIAVLTSKREIESSEAKIIQINKEIKKWEELKKAKESAGRETQTTISRVMITDIDESANSIQRVQSNLDILNKLFETANEQQRRLLNPQIDMWTKRMEEMRKEGVKGAQVDEGANTLRGYLENVRILREALMDASSTEQEALKASIKAWQDKADAVEASAEKQEDGINKTANALKSLGSAFRGMGDAFEVPALDAMGIMAGAIATMIQSYALALSQAKSLGPWGWLGFAASGLATLMTMISQVKSAGAFATGGIVGGNSPVGDKLFARVNSGEMILNRTQQTKLFNMLNRGVSLPAYTPPEVRYNPHYLPSTQPINVVGDIRIAGREIEIALANEKRAGAKIGRRRN